MSNIKDSKKQPQKRAIRKHRYEVRLSDDELEKIKLANPSSVAKFLRDTAMSSLSDDKNIKQTYYSSIDREFVLELSRIGNNINQIAKAINSDLAKDGHFDRVRLLHLLISINENLENLKK